MLTAVDWIGMQCAAVVCAEPGYAPMTKWLECMDALIPRICVCDCSSVFNFPVDSVRFYFVFQNSDVVAWRACILFMHVMQMHCWYCPLSLSLFFQFSVVFIWFLLLLLHMIFIIELSFSWFSSWNVKCCVMWCDAMEDSCRASDRVKWMEQVNGLHSV